MSNALLRETKVNLHSTQCKAWAHSVDLTNVVHVSYHVSI